MFEMICNIPSQQKMSSSKDNNFLKIIDTSELSKSFLNKLNQYLLTKEIEFDNVFTEEKKDDDKNIVSSNFIINNLLNIFYKNNIGVNSKNLNSAKDHKIQKKKIDQYKNDLLNIMNSINFFKKIKNSSENKNKETLKIDRLPKKVIRHDNQLNQMSELNNVDIIKNLFLKKVNNKNSQKTINIINFNKKNINIIKYEKKMMSPLDIKRNNNDSSSSQDVNKIFSLINRKNLLKNVNETKCIQLNIEPLILKNSKNSIEWQKLITHKIFLSIANKDNQAEIHLKPESLGSIHILVNVENNAAKLKFISKYNEIRMFLDIYRPFLSHSLMKNGIKLEKCDILSSLKNEKLKNHKNLLYKKNYNVDEFKQESNISERKSDLIKYRSVDVYI